MKRIQKFTDKNWGKTYGDIYLLENLPNLTRIKMAPKLWIGVTNFLRDQRHGNS